MKKITFVIIGGGWRSEFYVHVAKALPELFECKGVWLRNEEKAIIYRKKMMVETFLDLEDCLNLSVDFFILSLPGKVNFEYCKKLVELGKHILMETPVAPDVDGLNEIWKLKQKTGAVIGIAEEYHLQPYFSSIISLVNKGFVGNPSYLYMSATSKYHFVNVARRLLQTEMEPFSVRGEMFERKMIKTCSRKGECVETELSQTNQEFCRIQFKDGKTVVYDFSPGQFMALLRSENIMLRAEKGEIKGNQVLYINEENECIEENIMRIDLGRYTNLQAYTHKGFTFNGRWIYKNPFMGASLSDDEIAVASELLGMQRYVETGEEYYPFRDALQDTYIYFLMKEAIDTGKEVQSTIQSWQIVDKMNY